MAQLLCFVVHLVLNLNQKLFGVNATDMKCRELFLSTKWIELALTLKELSIK